MCIRDSQSVHPQEEESPNGFDSSTNNGTINRVLSGTNSKQNAFKSNQHSLCRSAQGLRSVLRTAAAIRTSHAVFRTSWQGDPRVNIQNDIGKAKPYQVRQVVKVIDRWEAGV